MAALARRKDGAANTDIYSEPLGETKVVQGIGYFIRSRRVELLLSWSLLFRGQTVNKCKNCVISGHDNCHRKMKQGNLIVTAWKLGEYFFSQKLLMDNLSVKGTIEQKLEGWERFQLWGVVGERVSYRVCSKYKGLEMEKGMPY